MPKEPTQEERLIAEARLNVLKAAFHMEDIMMHMDMFTDVERTLAIHALDLQAIELTTLLAERQAAMVEAQTQKRRDARMN